MAVRFSAKAFSHAALGLRPVVRQVVLEEETAKVLEVIPSRVRGDKDRAQKFA